MTYSIKPLILIDDVVDAIEQLCITNENILIVSSTTVSSIKKVSDLVNSLKKTNSVDLYFDIKPDAPIKPLEIIQIKYPKPSIIIGIGGGSVIDSAKALSVAWNNTNIVDYFNKKASLPHFKNIELIVVPTTAGTGAELSYGSILFDEENKLKGGLRGEVLQSTKVIIDVELYLFASERLISEVGFDCLTHAIETYVSTASSPMVKYMSVNVIQTIFENLPGAVQKNKESMQKMAIAACLMGANLAFSTTCLPHRIQYAIGPLTKTTHAQGLIALYKGWLRIIETYGEFRALAKELSLTSEALVAKINFLKTELDLEYSLSQFGLEEKDFDKIVKDVNGNLQNDPSYESSETINKILKYSL